jgi:hypothetical protein
MSVGICKSTDGHSGNGITNRNTSFYLPMNQDDTGVTALACRSVMKLYASGYSYGPMINHVGQVKNVNWTSAY